VFAADGSGCGTRLPTTTQAGSAASRSLSDKPFRTRSYHPTNRCISSPVHPYPTIRIHFTSYLTHHVDPTPVLPDTTDLDYTYRTRHLSTGPLAPFTDHPLLLPLSPLRLSAAARTLFTSSPTARLGTPRTDKTKKAPGHMDRGPSCYYWATGTAEAPLPFLAFRSSLSTVAVYASLVPAFAAISRADAQGMSM